VTQKNRQEKALEQLGGVPEALRVSVVRYLNTAPLIWGLEQGPLRERYRLNLTLPSSCADDLAAGRAEVGILPGKARGAGHQLADLGGAGARPVRAALGRRSGVHGGRARPWSDAQGERRRTGHRRPGIAFHAEGAGNAVGRRFQPARVRPGRGVVAADAPAVCVRLLGGAQRGGGRW
jgi:hypothetical protein